jgi:hypothetical protein
MTQRPLANKPCSVLRPSTPSTPTRERVGAPRPSVPRAGEAAAKWPLNPFPSTLPPPPPAPLPAPREVVDPRARTILATPAPVEATATTPRRMPPPLPQPHVSVADSELIEDEIGATTQTAPPASEPSKRALLGVFAGLVASATAVAAAVLLWLPSEASPASAAARLDTAVTSPANASTPSASSSSALAQVAAPKAGKTHTVHAPKAKTKPGRSTPSAKANSEKPTRKPPKAVAKPAKPAPKKRAASTGAR